MKCSLLSSQSLMIWQFCLSRNSAYSNTTWSLFNFQFRCQVFGCLYCSCAFADISSFWLFGLPAFCFIWGLFIDHPHLGSIYRLESDIVEYLEAWPPLVFICILYFHYHIRMTDSAPEAVVQLSHQLQTCFWLKHSWLFSQLHLESNHLPFHLQLWLFYDDFGLCFSIS